MDLAEVSARSRAVGEVAAKAVLTNDRAPIIATVLTNGSMAQTGDVNGDGKNDIAATKKGRHCLP
jgi:FG-GAP repeat